MKLSPLLLLATILPSTASCSHEPTAPPSASASSGSGATPVMSSGANPAATPAAAPAAGAPASGAPGAASGLAFAAQPGWVVEKPTSAMRKAQFRLPHVEKDAEDASLVVYFFSGQGGDLQANLDRWCGQFQQPDGKSSSDVLKSSTRTVNGMNVHEADLSGTYVAETAPGSGEHVRKEGWRMLAAILEAKDGPYYAKLVGPSATVAKWEESFRSFVNAAKPGS
jgi:hypothetical protein